MAKSHANKNEDDFEVVVEGEEERNDAAVKPPASDEDAHEDDEDEESSEEQAVNEEVASEDDDSLIDSETAAKRERRRKERQDRKLQAKDREERTRLKLESQQRIINEQSQRLAALERKDISHDLAQLDVRIQNAQQLAGLAQQELQKSIATGDGALHTAAMQTWYRANKEFEDLNAYKNNLTRAAARPVEAKEDPTVKHQAEQWARRNTWYDPGQRDTDSKVAFSISTDLANEGFSPADSTYWDQLDSRLRKYLPHRYEQTTRQQTRAQVVVGGAGSSRLGGGSGTFVLSKERAEAIKAAGAWDDPTERKKLIAAYRNYDKAHG